jgi:hypothetical protein
LVPAQPTTLVGETSRPDTSTYVVGEPVELTFSGEGVSPGVGGLALLVTVRDEHGASLMSRRLPIPAGPDGRWSTKLAGPSGRLGFYRVEAKLSTGATLPKLGTRPAGLLTYCVVPDPSKRKLYPERETFFGMQTGFGMNLLPYLGVRWVLGGYRWGETETERLGEFVDKWRAAGQWGRPAFPPVRVLGKELQWKTYTIPNLYGPNERFFSKVYIPSTVVAGYGALTPEGEAAWRAYCLEVGRAYPATFPERQEHIYEITWEPVYPWRWKGTDEQLLRVYQIAYGALHEVDPKAAVAGPCLSSITEYDTHARLFRKGLGKFLDAFSVHAYVNLPPERNGLRDLLRRTRQMVRRSVGRELPMLGTEQGYSTVGSIDKEIIQARGLVRANLIHLGEGWRFNFAFYGADYFYEPGFGFYYNLNPKIEFGSDKVGPKPVAPAYAAMTSLLEGHRPVRTIDWLGETTLGYAYERPGDLVVALWDWGGAPRQVRLPVGSEMVDLYDWMGNRKRVPAPGGLLRLTLSEEPVYLKGVSADLWGRGAGRALRPQRASLDAFPGGSARVSASVTPPPGGLVGDLTLSPDTRLAAAGLTRHLRLPVGARRDVSLELKVPPGVPAGTYPLQWVLSSRSRPVATTGCLLRVLPPLSVRQVVPKSVKSEPVLEVLLQEDRGTVAKGTLEASLDGVPGSRRQATFSLPPKGSQRLLLPYEGVAVSALRLYTVRLAVTTSAGYRLSHEARATFLSAVRFAAPPSVDGDLSDWKAVPSHLVRGRQWVSRGAQYWHGDDDCWARVRFGWDARALYLAFEVRDDVFMQRQTGYDTWKDDCVQLGIDLEPLKAAVTTGNMLADAGTRRRRSELDLALTPKGPEAYRTASADPDRLPVGAVTPGDLRVAVTRRPAPGGGVVLTYGAAIPWRTLGADRPPAPGSCVGISAAINDRDDETQLEPKALGLFELKDPSRFGLLYLEP